MPLAFALPLLALFCCLRSDVSAIGFLALASTLGLRWGPLVVVAVLGFLPLGCEVLRLGYWVSFPGASPSFHCPYPASQLLPVFLQGIRSVYCGGVSSHVRGSSPFSSFRGCLHLLILDLVAVFFFLSSSFCRALLLSFLVHIPPSWGFLLLYCVILCPLLLPCASLSCSQSFRFATHDPLFH